MADSINPGAPVSNVSPFDAEMVRFVVIFPKRRRLLVALARGKPMSPSQLRGVADSTVDGTFKQLEKMRAAGFVLRKEDPTDDRRWLYELAPEVPVKVTPTGKVIDFGFIKIPVR